MRLRDLDPHDVAEQAHAAAIGLATTLAIATGHDLVPGGLSDIRLAAHVVAHYARAGSLPDDAPLQEYLISLLPLYVTASGSGSVSIPELDQSIEPATPWGLVIVAAVARERLAAGRPLTHAQPAVLASMSPGRLSQLAAAGDAPRRRQGGRDARQRLYTAAGCVAWLRARGVAGL